MPSHQERVKQANCDHNWVEIAASTVSLDIHVDEHKIFRCSLCSKIKKE